MPWFDLPRETLQTYRPELSVPDDFDEFWTTTLTEARAYDQQVTLDPYPLELPLVEAYDASFVGAGGAAIRGWFVRPRDAVGELPCVVRFLGYGDGRGTPLEWLALPCAGFAVLVMDSRGQGARKRGPGATADPYGGTHPYVDGFLTQGVLDPQDFYYRRVFTDAVRAVEVARSLSGIDASRIAVAGGSQGGGIALAAAALADGVSALCAQVPFLCHFRRAVEITERGPYFELLQFLRGRREDADQALATLDYFDGVHLATRARVPALFSAGGQDQVCPPSTVFAAYNHYAGPKDIELYPYNEHEGGGLLHEEREIRWLRTQLAD